MPATNAREKILEAVKVKLEGLKKSAGYQNDIGTVARFAIPLEQMEGNGYPAVFILDDGAETNLNEWGGQIDDPTVRADMDLKLLGYYEDADPKMLSTGFNQFKADLDKLFWASNTLAGTQADDMQLTGYDAFYTLEDRGIVIFQANLRIRYWFSKGNP